MTNNDRIEIGKEFVRMHKHSNVNEWQLPVTDESDAMYLNVYWNLEGGVYGHRELQSVGAGLFWRMEISGGQTRSGIPMLFEWDADPDDEALIQ